MIIQIDSHGGVPIYRQVMDQVRQLILTGQMAEGEQLESVKNLSARLKVNPMTISKAYSFLVQEGLVERRRGLGLFVNRIRSEAKKQQRNSVLEKALRQAAALAVQMDVPEAEAVELLKKHYSKMSSQEGRKVK